MQPLELVVLVLGGGLLAMYVIAVLTAVLLALGLFDKRK